MPSDIGPFCGGIKPPILKPNLLAYPSIINIPTIDEIRDMIQNDPRYNKLTAAQMDEVVKRETVRADFAYNMGISPEEVDDQIVDMLMMEGYASRFGFNIGGLIPPQKGPMSEGMGTLYRSK